MNCFHKFKKNCFSCCLQNRVTNKREIDIIVLGLKGSGKTELCHSLSKTQRTVYSSTIGVHVFDLEFNKFCVKLIEIGGDEKLIDIWKFYYADCLGVIYLINADRSEENITKNRETLKMLLSKNFLNGKPFLIVGTFQDKPNTLNLFEFCCVYDFEQFASIVKTPIYVDIYDIETYQTMRNGLNWLTNLIYSNYHAFVNRRKFDQKIQKMIMDETTANSDKTVTPRIFRPATAPPAIRQNKRKSFLNKKNLIFDNGSM